MALSEISIIREELKDTNLPLDIIKEIIKFLSVYNRHDLRGIPNDGVTRIFALNMRIYHVYETRYQQSILHDGDIYVTRSSGEFTFNFAVNGIPWKLSSGSIYPYGLCVIFERKSLSRIDIILLPHSSECQDS